MIEMCWNDMPTDANGSSSVEKDFFLGGIKGRKEGQKRQGRLWLRYISSVFAPSADFPCRFPCNPGVYSQD